jgi:hypothetical protein
MDSSLLTTEQAKVLCEQVRRHLAYLRKLHNRMVERGFPPDDKLMQLTEHAYDATHALSVELHYLTCKCGVGQQTRHRGRR